MIDIFNIERLYNFNHTDTLDNLDFCFLSTHTNVLTSNKGFYKGDSYYYTGGGFDTESTTIKTVDEKGKTNIQHCFCYLFQFSVGNTVYFVRTLKQFNIFITKLINYLKNKETIKVKVFNSETKRAEYKNIYPKFIFWVANLGHEFSFIKSELKNFDVTNFFAKDERHPLLIELNGVLQFRECLGLFGNSLSDIATKHTNLEKQSGKDFNYNLIRTSATELTDNDIKYSKYDVLILSQLHSKVISELAIKQNDSAIVIPYTSTGYIRHECKEEITKSKYVSDLKDLYNMNKKSNLDFLKWYNSKKFVSELQWNICRNYSYAGGLCGSNPNEICKKLKNIWCFDLNSDYPAQMNHEKYPVGEMSVEHRNLTNENQINELIKQNIPLFAFMRVDIKAKTQHCVFSRHKVFNPEKSTIISVNGKIKIGKNLNVCWNDIDIETYKLAYDIKIIEVYSIWKFEGYASLPDYIIKPLNERYKAKTELKLKGLDDTPEYINSKRYVNGFYGMCSTKEQYTETIFKDGFCENVSRGTFLDIQKEFWLNPYIAFWVTSYARRILIKFITKYPNDVIQYDTDSLYIKCSNRDLLNEIYEYNKTILEKNKKLFPNDKIMWDLGQWDNKEKDRFDIFIAMGAKKYVKVHDNVVTPVIAGLPKSTFETMLKDTKKYSVNKLLKICTNLLNSSYNIENEYHEKLASKYDDNIEEKNVKIIDYKGNEYIQTFTGYHALFDIDFKLDISPDFKR